MPLEPRTRLGPDDVAALFAIAIAEASQRRIVKASFTRVSIAHVLGRGPQGASN